PDPPADGVLEGAGAWKRLATLVRERGFDIAQEGNIALIGHDSGLSLASFNDASGALEQVKLLKWSPSKKDAYIGLPSSIRLAAGRAAVQDSLGAVSIGPVGGDIKISPSATGADGQAPFALTADGKWAAQAWESEIRTFDTDGRVAWSPSLDKQLG